MPNRINLGLLYGGKSCEHEVSLLSAASVLSHLDASRYNIIPIGIDKTGCYFVNDYQALLSLPSLPVVTEHSRPLASLIKNGKLAIKADVIFPVVHGTFYEDGCLQGILKSVNVAFVGCDVLSSAIGMDKDIARLIVRAEGIHSARYHRFSWRANVSNLEPMCEKIVANLGWPLFVKPCTTGSSVGIQKAKNMPTLLAAIEDASCYDDEILIEEYIEGREIELAVLENKHPTHPPHVSVAGEIRVHHADGFYSYTAKYIDCDQTELLVPAQLDERLLKQLQQTSATIFSRLKCKGMARIDYFVNEKTQTIYFNEVNTLPGFTKISMYPKLWQASGLAYSTLLDTLIELALINHRYQQQRVSSYEAMGGHG